MIKKKIVLSALILLSLSVTACNTQGQSGSASASSEYSSSESSSQQGPHVHSYDKVWASDDTYHWHKCLGTTDDGQPCPEVGDKAEHTWDNGETVTPAGLTLGRAKFTCTVCKRVKYEEIPPTGSQEAYREDIVDGVPVYNFHTELQRQYLADEWTTNTKYIPSVNAEDHRQHDDLSLPTAITLDYKDVASASKYYVQIADNSSFSNAKLIETTQKLYSFYNAKLGTQYYFRAATSESGLGSATVKTFKTSNQAPRNLKVDGVLNFRDVGGWATSLVPNGRVKQGLYYRCGQFDNKSIVNITEAGKATIKELGIKVDIDMRDSNQVPTSSPANSSGYTLEVYKASIASGTESQRFSGFADVYKGIFDKIKNADSKPIALHCTHGADRTGIASFFLLAVLGVSEEDCGRDYSFTRFAGQRSVKHEVEFDGWVSGTKAYASQLPSGVPEKQKFAEEMKLHLKSKGITEDTIETIREKFIEGYHRPQ